MTDLDDLQQAALSLLRTDAAAAGDLLDALRATGGPVIGERLGALARGTGRGDLKAGRGTDRRDCDRKVAELEDELSRLRLEVLCKENLRLYPPVAAGSVSEMSSHPDASDRTACPSVKHVRIPLDALGAC